jgi:hypothetical protein
VRAPQSVADDYLDASGLADAVIAVRFGSSEVRGRLLGLSLDRGICLRGDGDRAGEAVHVPLELVREIRML